MFDKFDYKDEIQHRFEEQERQKQQYEQERRNNIVPQGIRIPSKENGIVPTPDNPLYLWYKTQKKVHNIVDREQQLKAQPNLLSGGNFEYQQPTRQTPYQPNKFSTNLNETLVYEVPEDELHFDGKNLNWINDNKIYKS